MVKIFASLAAGGLAIASAQYIGQGEDGNPQNWDRTRRCDNNAYDPPCGVCEGVGGMAWGDLPEEYYPTTCEVVADADEIDQETLVRPVWAPRFYTNNYYETLIGPITDPACFGFFPSNSSEGTLCYRNDTGSQTYDMIEARGIREDLVAYTLTGPVDSLVLHVDDNFWIVNELVAGSLTTTQCICVHVREGFGGTDYAYAVQYNFLDQFFYVGREMLGIEYINGESNDLPVMELDHWAYGPHHVWSQPEDGLIIRMWQPFNGLQVFTGNSTNPSDIPAGSFDDVPPSSCVDGYVDDNGLPSFRITCTDDGYPEEEEEENSVSAASESEMARAAKKVPHKAYKGANFTHMSDVLNGWLDADAAVNSRPCEEWTANELQALQSVLFLAKDVSFEKVYQAAEDNRRIGDNIQDIRKTWADLNAITAGSPEHAEVQRDGHCHEAVMWYVHHLTMDVKRLMGESGIRLPTLPKQHHSQVGACASTPSNDDHAKVCKHYEYQVSCFDCHSDTYPDAAATK